MLIFIIEQVISKIFLFICSGYIHVNIENFFICPSTSNLYKYEVLFYKKFFNFAVKINNRKWKI